MFKSIEVAFSNLLKPVHTVKYPFEPIALPKEYRGLIEHSPEDCIWCDKCEKVCPPKAIVFHQNMDGTKTYDYNQWLCIYCGECVRACPKPGEAIWQSEKKQEVAVKEQNVNSTWFEWQEKSYKSRDDYKVYKAEQRQKAKEAKAAEPAQHEAEGSETPSTPEQ